MARILSMLGAVVVGLVPMSSWAQQVYYYSPEPSRGAAPPASDGRNYSVLGVGAHAFYYRYDEGDDDGVGYGLEVVLRPFSILAIDAGVDWYQHVFEEEVQDGAYVVRFDVDEEALDAFLGLRLYLSGSWVIQPYLTAGVDYMDSDDTLRALVEAPGGASDELAVDGGLDDTVGYHLGAGFDWVLNRYVALTAEARWVSADLEAEIEAGDIEIELEEAKADVLTFRVGMRVGF